MIDEQKILLVGCGNMGSALLRGWMAQGIDPSRIAVVDAQEAALARATEHGIAATRAPGPHVVADTIVFAVKPQQLDAVVGDYREACVNGALVLTIAAGKPIGWFESALSDGVAVVRAMPNTPAAIGRGITALVANEATSPEQRMHAETLMRAGGETIWLDDEALMDAVTAVSGSGPAYVFLLIEALQAAGEEAGLAPELALKLAVETVAGAGAYASAAHVAPATLRKQVTSPGGTTEAALEILMAANGIPDLLRAAVAAAAARSRELARTQ